jgi:hypothetical protein
MTVLWSFHARTPIDGTGPNLDQPGNIAGSGF